MKLHDIIAFVLRQCYSSHREVTSDTFKPKWYTQWCVIAVRQNDTQMIIYCGLLSKNLGVSSTKTALHRVCHEGINIA